MSLHIPNNSDALVPGLSMHETPRVYRQTKERQQDLYIPEQLLIPGRHHNLYKATLTLYHMPATAGLPECHRIEVDVQMGLKRSHALQFTVPVQEFRKMWVNGRAEVTGKLRDLIEMKMREIY